MPTNPKASDICEALMSTIISKTTQMKKRNEKESLL